MEKEKYSVVTEVGDFGGVNIKDPTVKDVEKEDDTEALIRESIEVNARNLEGFHN